MAYRTGCGLIKQGVINDTLGICAHRRDENLHGLKADSRHSVQSLRQNDFQWTPKDKCKWVLSEIMVAIARLCCNLKQMQVNLYIRALGCKRAVNKGREMCVLNPLHSFLPAYAIGMKSTMTIFNKSMVLSQGQP
ncbi:MAG: hypothetical protein JHC88_00200 [Niveispirillum sp.]|nr:hypothetical protein [Niveispirillum sp.]